MECGLPAASKGLLNSSDGLRQLTALLAYDNRHKVGALSIPYMLQMYKYLYFIQEQLLIT